MILLFLLCGRRLIDAQNGKLNAQYPGNEYSASGGLTK